MCATWSDPACWPPLVTENRAEGVGLWSLASSFLGHLDDFHHAGEGWSLPQSWRAALNSATEAKGRGANALSQIASQRRVRPRTDSLLLQGEKPLHPDLCALSSESSALSLLSPGGVRPGSHSPELNRDGTGFTSNHAKSTSPWAPHGPGPTGSSSKIVQSLRSERDLKEAEGNAHRAAGRRSRTPLPTSPDSSLVQAELRGPLRLSAGPPLCASVRDLRAQHAVTG